MYCAHCGNEVENLATNCPTCGGPASGAPKSAQRTSTGLIVALIVGGGLMLVVIIGIIAAIAIPNFLNAAQRGRQKRTMADMRTVGTAIEAHAVDFGFYPNVDLIEDLAANLEPAYVRVMPRTDGWSNAFEYTCWQVNPESKGCDSFVIASAAGDGIFEQGDLKDYGVDEIRTTHFDRDIVYRNGGFSQCPAGL